MAIPTAAARPEWDYTEHADAYLARPDYPAALLERLAAHVGRSPRTRIVEIGAGTGNMTLCLAPGPRASYVAVEPNAAMRRHGVERTADLVLEWREATGEATGMPAASCDWIMMAQCFDTMDAPAALAEARRILAPGGFLTVLWNHRSWSDDPVEAGVEKLVAAELGRKGYDRGRRREDQASVLVEGGLFGDLFTAEAPHEVVMDAERYVQVWRSVRTLRVQAGAEGFERILDRIRAHLAGAGVTSIPVKYVTRSWTVRRR